jgi:cytochrome c2
MAGSLWNHAPAMWAAMESAGVAVPLLSEQETADLFVYLFAAHRFERPGDAKRGEQVLLAKRCGECHGIRTAAREGIQPVAAWNPVADPIALAQRMWNHSREMRLALDRVKIPYPQLSAQELTDLLAYLRRTQKPGQASDLSSGSGEKLFLAKGCAGCHRGALALEARPTRYSLADFAAVMWNHSFQGPTEPAPLSYDEMRRLLGYVVSTQFFEEGGDLERGEKVFARKRCAACHDDPSSGAPSRSVMAGTMTSFGMVAAIWEHGPAMLKRMRLNKIPWPRFSGSEMADLTAYLHGLQLERRRPPMDPARCP